MINRRGFGFGLGALIGSILFPVKVQAKPYWIVWGDFHMIPREEVHMTLLESAKMYPAGSRQRQTIETMCAGNKLIANLPVVESEGKTFKYNGV